MATKVKTKKVTKPVEATVNQQHNIRFRPKSRKRYIGFTDEQMDKIATNLSGAKCALFSGDTGTGKTTLAKIIAKELAPIENIREINCGSDGGIDEVRKAISESKRKTLNGKPRIFLLDEAHKLTKQAFDALLTPTEGEDLNTLWWFCSNEPQRIPPVLQRRMLKIRTPTWNEDMLLQLAKRVHKETGEPIPKNLKQFANPSELLLAMQQGDADSGVGTNAPTKAAAYILGILCNGKARGRVPYDFKYSTIMEISCACRSLLGAVLPYEQPDATLVGMLAKADKALVARIAQGCAHALRDDTRPAMVLLDMVMGFCVAKEHFGK